MFSKREIIIFFAGAQVFHTLSHIAMYFFITFPMQLSFMTITLLFNFWAIMFNAITAGALLWWASTLKK
jgi:hypothetical protein